MDIIKFRLVSRTLMSVGSAGAIIGGAMMALGLRNSGDVIMVAGFVVLIVGVAMLAQTPPGENDVD